MVGVIGNIGGIGKVAPCGREFLDIAFGSHSELFLPGNYRWETLESGMIGNLGSIGIIGKVAPFGREFLDLAFGSHDRSSWESG